MSGQEPRAALLIVGAEVLSGKVSDANGPFLLRSLRALGVEVSEVRIVGDIIEAIADATRSLARSNDWLLTTGGIGPTHDDVTLGGIAAGFGLPLASHPELVAALELRGAQQARAPAHKMAEVPVGAEVLWTPGGAFPVFKVLNTFVLPGVPEFVELCLPHIAEQLRGRPFYSQSLLVRVGEAELAHPLAEAQRSHPEVGIGSYPRFDSGAPYRVKVTFDGRDRGQVEAALAHVRAALPRAWLLPG